MTVDASRGELHNEVQHSALLHLLSNSLVLSHLAPLLSCADLLNLAATSRAFRYLVYRTPQVWRRLDLTQVRSAQFEIDGIDHGVEVWRNVQVDENLTEDDFYSGPLRGILSHLCRTDILRDVQVLLLDSLSVTAELVHDILTYPLYSVRVLSLRDVKNLNERKLCAALQYACRASRPEGIPRLRGLYVFGPKENNTPAASSLPPSPSPNSSPAGVGALWNTRSQKALTASLDDEPESWYTRRGEQFPRRNISPEWAATLVACAGKIAFDAVLCTGPRHLNSSAWGAVDVHALNAAESSATPGVPAYAVATHSLDGCAGCGAAPEGFTVWGDGAGSPSPERGGGRRGSDGEGGLAEEIGSFPLLAPPPLHSADVRVAMCPAGQPVNPRSRLVANNNGGAGKASFIPRCAGCLRDRYCSSCRRWWCEACYTGPMAGHVHDSSSTTTTTLNEGGAVGGSAHTWPTGMHKSRVSKSCWECGMNCRECTDYTQRMCRRCRANYCLIHNEGSNMIACDWCSSGSRLPTPPSSSPGVASASPSVGETSAAETRRPFQSLVNGTMRGNARPVPTVRKALVQDDGAFFLLTT